MFVVIFQVFLDKKSIFYLVKLNNDIIQIKDEINYIDLNNKYIISKIKLLKDSTLDTDYVSEIANKKLGLILPNRVVVKNID